MTELTPQPPISFEQAFNQALDSLDLKSTLILIGALSQKAIMMQTKTEEHKAKVQHILTN